MSSLHDFHGPNAGYILELYDRYQQNPDAVDSATKSFFEHWTPPQNGLAAAPVAPTTGLDIVKITGVVNLAQAIREYGHLAAQLDPLGSPPPGDPTLAEEYHGLTKDDMRQLPASLIAGPIIEISTDALDAIQKLRRVYSSTTGYDYDHMRQPEKRDWLRYAAECRRFRPSPERDDYVGHLKQLTQIEVFERFLHRSFPGKTRFSIEGLDMMIPILTEIIGQASGDEIYTILIGMAHRGRLNVLSHVLRKPYAQILAEFKDPVNDRSTGAGYQGWTGDVKYHKGALRAVRADETGSLVVSMAPNPSHLELINPVVAGMARAAGSRVDQPGPPRFNDHISLPILIHGDASFSGQGVVSETLNFYRLPGYYVGGTIHIIANNQLGFTTDPETSRSTLYASDLAKGFKIPIVHVNADDPEACIEVARIAYAYIQEFREDFVIDLIGYRRYGHNEGDEPRFTQPLMYKKIDNHSTVREQWAKKLVEWDLIDPDEPEEMVERHFNKMQTILDELQPEAEILEPDLETPPPGAAKQAKTAIPLERLQALNQALLHMPDGFTPHPRLERVLKPRRIALDDPDEPTIDWATAETLALASILEDGTAIRLTGEDVERGTFSHRHAVWHDMETGSTFTPLQALPQAKAAFEILDSPLSENAAVGFEYGYNIQEPDRLVVWEAQYGDFINGAQPIIDEFVVSGRDKWEQTPSLVLLLPHGYEGQGPDHSTGRLERFLEAAADINIRIANCTTAAQYFHLLRRQALLLKTDPLPLIVMTPKSLLRNPLVASPARDLVEGRWQPVIDDLQARQSPDQIERLILCSGKIYVDLISSDYHKESPAIAIARIEQLYPLLPEAVLPLFEGYPALKEVVWVQEEPRNMGAWRAMKPQLNKLIAGRWPLRCLSRPRRASPAEGSAAWHAVNQQQLIKLAFTLE
jgi:2-oxoglutarate dehydrogenase E1 component